MVKVPNCVVANCIGKVHGNGLCEMHYRRIQRHGGTPPVKATVTQLSLLVRCSVCRTEKWPSDYYPHYLICKKCVTANSSRIWYADPGESRRRKRAKFWAKRERYRQYSQNDYAWHREKRLAACAAYRKAHPELIAAVHRSWRLRNRDRYLANVRIICARRRVRMRQNQVGVVTAKLIAAKVAYWGDRCWMCKGPWREIDHVKPVAKGGAHMLCNLRPICRSCNAKKSATWPLARLT